MISIAHRLAVAAAMLAALSAPCLAQGTGAGPVGRQCSKDIDKFCAGMRHGNAEIRACLEAKRSQLSIGSRVIV